MMFDPDHKGLHTTSPRSAFKHMNGHSNGYPNGHRMDQMPKARMDHSRSPYDHHEPYSSNAYSYARSTASSSDSSADYSPPTGAMSEPVKPYSPYYQSVGSPRDYPRGANTPPYYAHAHHTMNGPPPPLSLPPPTSHVEGGRALPPPSSLLRHPTPPPRHESPQLPPILGMDGRHLSGSHHPHSPLVPSKREHESSSLAEQIDHLRVSNEQLRGRVMELELVNDLMKSRVAELESAEQKSRTIIDSYKSEISLYQSRENELYRKIASLQDELVDQIKIRHSRSPSNASSHGEESSAKRRKVSLSELVDEKSKVQQQPLTQVSEERGQSAEPSAIPQHRQSPISNGVEVKAE